MLEYMNFVYWASVAIVLVDTLVFVSNKTRRSERISIAQAALSLVLLFLPLINTVFALAVITAFLFDDKNIIIRGKKR